MDEVLIAPCGMNCGICNAYLRDKNPCPGCQDVDTRCIIKRCETIKTNTSGFCFECKKYPCRRLKQLDKRYSSRYNMSMIENLECIRENGIDRLIEREE